MGRSPTSGFHPWDGQVEARWPTVWSKQETGPQESRVPPLLCPDSALVAMGAFPMVTDAPWSGLGEDELKREGQRDGQNLPGPPQGYRDTHTHGADNSTSCGCPSHRPVSEKAGEAGELGSPKCHLLQGSAGLQETRSPDTCAHSRVFKRLSSHRCSHPRSYTLTCAPC